MCVLSAYGTHRVEFFPMKFALVIHLIEWQKSLGTALPSLPATVTLTLSNSLTHTRARSQAREVRARLFRARENREENIKFSQCLPQCVRRRPSSEISSTQNVPMLLFVLAFFPRRFAHSSGCRCLTEQFYSRSFSDREWVSIFFGSSFETCCCDYFLSQLLLLYYYVLWFWLWLLLFSGARLSSDAPFSLPIISNKNV